MRRIAILAGAFALLIGFAVTASWFIAVNRVEESVAAWTERQRAGGWLFTHGEIEIGGYPFRVDLVIPSPALASADGLRRWEGPSVHAVAPLWQPGRLDYDAAGRHRYRFTGAGGLQHEITFDMLAAAGTAELAEDRIRSGSLNALSVRITGAAPGEIVLGSVEAMVRIAPEKAADLKSESASLAVSARSVALVGEANVTALSEPIQSADIFLALTGPLPWGDAPDALSHWRDAGGTLELRRIALAWSALALEGEGTLALDSRMRPEGALALRLDGLQPTLQKLTAAGDLPPADAERVRQMVEDLASPDVAVPGRLLIAIAAQDGRLTIGDRPYRILRPITAP